MKQEIIADLSRITEEEQAILDGKTEVEKERYSSGQKFVMDAGKLLERGKLIDIRPHTRFVRFPAHSHNYVEMIYMCQGSTVHTINGDRIELKTGELLILNQNAVQEIEPAGRDDIAVNFLILPEFFDQTLRMIGAEENQLKDFIVGCLKSGEVPLCYLHYRIADVLPVQNLIENLVWTLLHHQSNKRSINQVTMGLLFLHLMHHTDRIRSASSSFDQQLIFQVLKFIDENYRDGQLTDLAAQLGYEIPWLSRAIKRLLGRTYKELLQIKRLNQAAFLLQSPRLPITDICAAVGYDNTSYFHRIFREYYHMSPKEYRCQGN